jgi:hypothetical protein
MVNFTSGGRCCLASWAWWFGFVDLEAGDGLGGGASDLGEQAVIVIDPPGGVGGLDG